MARRTGSRWTEAEQKHISDYIEKHKEVSIAQLARELAEQLDRSADGVVSQIYAIRKERKEDGR